MHCWQNLSYHKLNATTYVFESCIGDSYQLFVGKLVAELRIGSRRRAHLKVSCHKVCQEWLTAPNCGHTSGHSDKRSSGIFKNLPHFHLVPSNAHAPLLDSASSWHLAKLCNPMRRRPAALSPKVRPYSMSC